MKLNIKKIANESLRLQHDASDPLCAYLYDLSALKEHIQLIMSGLPENCELFYAAKANSDQPILDVLSPWVDGFEVASGGELNWVQQHAPGKSIIFGGPGKLDSELRHAIDTGVELIHVESHAEIRRIIQICQDLPDKRADNPVDILLRINLKLDNLPTTTLTMGGAPTPFGIDAAELGSVIAFLKNEPFIRLRGFHFHLLSHQLDVQAQLALLQWYLRQVKAWQSQYKLNIDHINVGGGIGINYRHPENQFDWSGFCHGLQRLVEDEAMQGYLIRFECGRYITASCGYYVMQVLDIKHNLGETFAVCRGGTHHFRTPYAQGHSHPFHVVSSHVGKSCAGYEEIANTAVTIVGQLCTPKDILARQIDITSLKTGDLVVFPYAGAYAWNISHHTFLKHPAPLVRYLNG